MKVHTAAALSLAIKTALRKSAEEADGNPYRVRPVLVELSYTEWTAVLHYLDNLEVGSCVGCGPS